MNLFYLKNSPFLFQSLSFLLFSLPVAISAVDPCFHSRSLNPVSEILFVFEN
jgi:hypothetical protein